MQSKTTPVQAPQAQIPQASQSHGFLLESKIRSELQRRQDISSLRVEDPHTLAFDAPSFQDPEHKSIPTSIKSAKISKNGNAVICLSDAKRILVLSESPKTRLVVALYSQEKNKKVFREIREYIITNKEWEKATGFIPFKIIENFCLKIQNDNYDRARLTARKLKEKLNKQYPSIIVWNAKIDSKNQRRLQCSIKLKDLDNLVFKKRIKVFGMPKNNDVRPQHLKSISKRMWGNGFIIPFELLSAPRVRNKKFKI